MATKVYKHSKPTTAGVAPHHPQYRPDDVRHFNAMMDFPEVGSVVDRDKSALSASRVSVYTDSDRREFEKLETFDTGYKDSRRSGRAIQANARVDFVYTDRDHHLFDELGSFERGAVSPTANKIAPKPVTESVAYTEHDLEMIRNLTPGWLESSSPVTSDNGQQPSPVDRDVGHIKIMDFDKQRAARKYKARTDPNMKIRFFE